MTGQFKVLVGMAVAGALSGARLHAAPARSIANGQVTVQALQAGGVYTGFQVLAGGRNAATVHLSSGRLLTAARCDGGARSLSFRNLRPQPGSGLTLDPQDAITVSLNRNDPYPVVSFRITIRGFDAAQWKAAAGMAPFHFLTITMPEAETWHQRGWLNATPVADTFPLLGDTHAGTPEISAYHYNRNWSYTPALGAHPIPIIGLWSPSHSHYAGFEFETTRLEDNSARDIATGYCWVPGQAGGPNGQFVSLVYPYGGTGYQQLVFPQPGSRLESHGVLLWSLNLPATLDPNRFFWSYLWKRKQTSLPTVPRVVDLSWVPGKERLQDFEGPPTGGLIGGAPSPFTVPGTHTLDGWRWHNESPTGAPAREGNTARLDALNRQAQQLLTFAKRFTVGGDACVYWDQPLEGRWADAWGGPAVTTLHNANGFAAGRLFLGLYRDAGKKDYLPIVDGVFNWAQHIAWTRNEFPDVPSSPFAIGGTLSASFCLDYYRTFRDAPDEPHRARARAALDLAHSFTYRYMVMWPSDNNRDDNLHPAFLWEPNSGRDWTGAACANEVFWNLDTLAQTAVITGDPILLWALQGSLDRWDMLYQDVSHPSLADYGPADMDEGYGLYAGTVYGVGKHSAYGFAGPLTMTEPVGDTSVRVLAGEGAALAFDKNGAHTSIDNYHFSQPNNLSFTVHSTLDHFNLSLTVPYTDLTTQQVSVEGPGQAAAVNPAGQIVHPPQAIDSLILRDLRSGDRVIIGKPKANAPALPSEPPRVETGAPPAGISAVALAYDSVPDASWDHLNSWAGLPRGVMWANDTPLFLAAEGAKSVLTRPAALAHPVVGAEMVVLAYSAWPGRLPSVTFSDGSTATVDSSQESLAWRAWPPIYSARLLMAPIPTRGKRVVRVDPGGRAVWALTALPENVGQATVLASLRAGAKSWRAELVTDKALAALKTTLGTIPQGSFAVIPPGTEEGTDTLLVQAGIADRGTALTPAQMVDPAIFNARKFRAAIYLDGETYFQTVKTPGDAADALVRYVEEGGTLILAGHGPFPLFYADGPGGKTPAPLTPRLGLPIYNAVEMTLPEAITFRLDSAGNGILDGPAVIPYPEGDTRLRSIRRADIRPDLKYTPIYTARGASGKEYGDAAGEVQFPGKGRVLYVWGGLLRDPQHDFSIVGSIAKYLQNAVNGG